MGANFGVVYTRGAKAKQVRALLERLAAEKGTRFLLAPAIRGWRGIYPQDYGHDPQIVERVTAEIGGDVLHLWMHDECVFGYSFFRQGRPVDEFCSDPAYADDVPPGESERASGRPELLAELLTGPEAVQELERVLRPEDGIVGLASFAVKDFARLLNLPNACTSYEYLMEDGWIERIIRFFTIKGLFRFQHIPSLRAEKQLRRRSLGRRRARWQQLQAEGKLLVYQPGSVGWVLNSQPHLCPNHAGNGFYVFWENERGEVMEHAPSWDQPRSAGLEIEGTRSTMSVSPSGRWLAVGHGYDPGHTQLWDMATSTRLTNLPTKSANHLEFTHDESRLAVFGSGELAVFELPSGKLLKRSKIHEEVSRGAFDPSGRFVVLVGHELTLFDWQRGKRLRRWKLGTQIEPPSEFSDMEDDLSEQFEDFSPQDFEKQFSKMVRQLGLPVAEAKQMLAEARQQHEQMQAMLESDEMLEAEEFEQSSEAPVAARFNANGQLLLCATDQGPRVYRWAEFPDVLDALEPTAASAKTGKERLGFEFAPPPLHWAEGEAYCEEGEVAHYDEINPGRYIYALAYDPHGERLLYGGMGGVICALDLATGAQRTLVELPGKPTIMELALSRDGAALACTTQPQFYRDSPKLAPELCIWDYAALLA